MDQQLQRFRAYELRTAFQGLEPGSRVLEIGGAQGYQAALMTNSGFVVESVDIAYPRGQRSSYFPVRLYDGVNLPFRSGAFDLIFSSNVLEHVQELPLLLTEMRRVLRPAGQAIHILPSPTWRIATSIAHYPHVARRIWSLLRATNDDRRTTEVRAGAVMDFGGRVSRALVPAAHGEFANSFVEILEYRRRAWINRFSKSGWRVVGTREAGLFYSGHTQCPGLSMEWRARLAKWFGSACTIYYCRPLLRVEELRGRAQAGVCVN